MWFLQATIKAATMQLGLWHVPILVLLSVQRCFEKENNPFLRTLIKWLREKNSSCLEFRETKWLEFRETNHFVLCMALSVCGTVIPFSLQTPAFLLFLRHNFNLSCHVEMFWFSLSQTKLQGRHLKLWWKSLFRWARLGVLRATDVCARSLPRGKKIPWHVQAE